VLSAQAQQLEPPTGSTQGTLTVTFRVVPSVGIVFGADGEPRIVVANTVDPRDNVSYLLSLRSTPLESVVSAEIGNAPTDAGSPRGGLALNPCRSEWHDEELMQSSSDRTLWR
jgi:hypothetical protein